MRPLVSDRSTRFTESVIREMTRLCQQHGGVNLAQGFPDFPAPESVKEAAARAVREPFYENNGPEATLPGAVPRFVRLRDPDGSSDPAELDKAFNNRTQAII